MVQMSSQIYLNLFIYESELSRLLKNPLEFSTHVHLLISVCCQLPLVQDAVITPEYHKESRCSFTFKLATGRRLSRDLAERGAETWPLDTPLTERKREHREHENVSFHRKQF